MTSARGCDADDGVEQQEEDTPLFMASLPSRKMFESNHALRALVNLAGDEEDGDNDDGDDSGQAEDGRDGRVSAQPECGAVITSSICRCRPTAPGTGRSGPQRRERKHTRSHPYAQSTTRCSTCGGTSMVHASPKDAQRTNRSNRRRRKSNTSVGEAQIYMAFLSADG